ncbi:MAG: class I SAM-dependent methyltransferase [Lachnospiraceae bacterium]|nr:class I SAM-dependent methyltransferase [Lachnospiraceae bacterium]
MEYTSEVLDLFKKKCLLMGAGDRGRRVLRYLKNSGIEVIGFLDNNKEKHNTKIEEVTVYPIETFKDRKDEVTVIITPKGAEELVTQLQEIYPVIIGEKTVDKLFCLPESAGYKKLYPLGHYYNLYPMIEDVESKKDLLYDEQKEILGVNLNIEGQLKMLEKMSECYHKVPDWKEIGNGEYRYQYDNLSLSPGDAIGLCSMLQVLKPKRVIEVGSGWTSAVMLDTNERLLKGSMELSFIEPYPDTLKKILRESDNIKLREERLENIELEYFSNLEDGDVLFIDSTHVSKMGSDVNYLFFEIIPRLKKGVYIHLHDIFYPFEYPMEWIYNGMVWNELYLLRAFLQNNNAYEIVFFQNMLEKKYAEKFKDKWPVNKPIHGGSFWMRKVE